MYQSLEATLHDTFWRSEEGANELPLLENFLKLHPGTSLEVGCGSGRLLLPLLEKGYEIEGVELSADMVGLLQRTAERSKLKATVHHCPIESFVATKQYSAISIPAFTLQLLSRSNAREVLTTLRELVIPGGGLYLTLFIPWAEILDELEIDTWHLDKEATTAENQQARCYTRHSLNRIEQELYREHRYELGGQTHFSEQTLQWYFLPEIVSLLENSGWKYNDYSADFELGSHDSDASVITIYATAF